MEVYFIADSLLFGPQMHNGYQYENSPIIKGPGHPDFCYFCLKSKTNKYEL